MSEPGRVHDPEHLRSVRALPCCAPGAGDSCVGVIEADHVGRRPVGRKCNDRETIPLCTLHHAERHALAGPFKGWGRERMREWLEQKLRETQVAADRGEATFSW